MSTRISISAISAAALTALMVSDVHAADGVAASGSAASSAEQVKRICKNVWKNDHYEEKCRTVRRAPPPAPRIDQPPSPPASRKDGSVKHPHDKNDVNAVSVRRPASE
ncbi:hypothetical protein AWB82_01661 [Caballeronia glebae]|uniref:Lipoprotein n=1 Tax=Caballeronia glebae TaxID=1777143 RepID=A0A158A3K3_9BURK|nr:hypothetical protein [Caballeronia glebae]SAK52378.1 hypothetical protein AWB82_01661 [Caballeronia glebae]